ncbi:hypothetical protein Tco_1216190 [Tanacetum coccineum]
MAIGEAVDGATHTLESLHTELSVSSLHKKFDALSIQTRKVDEFSAIMSIWFAEILHKKGKDVRAMLFLDFEHEQIDAYKSKYNDVADVNVIVPRINASDITAELGEDKEKEILGNIPLGCKTVGLAHETFAEYTTRTTFERPLLSGVAYSQRIAANWPHAIAAEVSPSFMSYCICRLLCRRGAIGYGLPGACKINLGARILDEACPYNATCRVGKGTYLSWQRAEYMSPDKIENVYAKCKSCDFG